MTFILGGHLGILPRFLAVIPEAPIRTADVVSDPPIRPRVLIQPERFPPA